MNEARKSNEPGLTQIAASDSLEHAWRYFELHSAQRMSMFNYFIAVFGFAAAGIGSCLQAGGALLLVGVVLGIVLSVVSFVFWKLDQRTSFLIKHSEEVLCRLEQAVLGGNIQVFNTEADRTRDHQRTSAGPLSIWTYGRSFRFIFLMAGLIGMAGSALCLTMRHTRPTASAPVKKAA